MGKPANNRGILCLEAAALAATAGSSFAGVAAAAGEEPPTAEALALQQAELLAALSWFDRACAVAPQDGDAALNFGVALLQLGRDQDALKHFEFATKKFPGHKAIENAFEVLAASVPSV
jgi:tetratricopeptide (TPR) repeat protein